MLEGCAFGGLLNHIDSIEQLVDQRLVDVVVKKDVDKPIDFTVEDVALGMQKQQLDGVP